MDAWPRGQQQQPQKRPFDEMNSGTSVSPSPHLFHNQHHSPTPDSIPSFSERRRTSHPHNHSIPPRSVFTPEFMSELRPQQRPSLEHRTSQTIIDLTDDVDVPEVISGPSRRSSERPPRLARTDNVSLGDIIDLTEDDDIQITHIISRPRLSSRPSMSRSRSNLASLVASRENSPLFVPRDEEINPVVPVRGAQLPPRPRIPHFMAAFGQNIGDIRDFIPNLQNFREHFVVLGGGGGGLPHIHLNYQAGGYGPPPKPDHEPPPEVGEGFTRSPTEDDIVVCPACDEELVAKKDTVEPPTKKSSKAPSKKDREEHPFWVVKSCGHVYCNACYLKARKPLRSDPDSKFPPISVPSASRPNQVKQSRGCAVEGCNTDVGDKRHWCGIFL